jgi:hypothetical protein
VFDHARDDRDLRLGDARSVVGDPHVTVLAVRAQGRGYLDGRRRSVGVLDVVADDPLDGESEPVGDGAVDRCVACVGVDDEPAVVLSTELVGDVGHEL